jgi:NTP pyrophosphatase (non-canonical NTP hydrolase)
MEIRPEVMAFAKVMEAKLRENDHKGGWKGCDVGRLLGYLREETDELAKELGNTTPCGCREAGCHHTPWRNPQRVAREAADIANFAMMIADVCEGLES